MLEDNSSTPDSASNAAPSKLNAQASDVLISLGEMPDSPPSEPEASAGTGVPLQPEASARDTPLKPDAQARPPLPKPEALVSPLPAMPDPSATVDSPTKADEQAGDLDRNLDAQTGPTADEVERAGGGRAR